jgi:hypothetical protein
MAKKVIKIPVVHHPKTNAHYAYRAVPHYADGVAADGGDCANLYCRYAFSYSFEGWGDEDPLPTDWLENPIWKGTLSVLSYWHGRSSASYYVQIDDGSEIPIEGFMTCGEFVDLIPKLVEGKASGVFKGVKRGQNYLIELAG